MDTFSDLKELGIEEEGEENIEFQAAASHIQTIASTLNNTLLLRLYGFYKQALEGDCHTPKPSWFDFKAKSKWEAWNDLKAMSKDDAKEKYIELVKEIQPNFISATSSKGPKESWVIFSTMQNPDGEDKTIDNEAGLLHFVKSGEYDAVKKYFNESANSGLDINALDDSGMGLIHWATDRGSCDIIRILIEHGADVNLRDVDGQAPIHYASSCGHLDCVEMLLAQQADPFAKDNDDLDAFAAASDDSVMNVLQQYKK